MRNKFFLKKKISYFFQSSEIISAQKKLLLMWNAFKSDLLDFVSTIQEDTSKTLKNVLGDSDEEEDHVVRKISFNLQLVNIFASIYSFYSSIYLF